MSDHTEDHIQHSNLKRDAGSAHVAHDEADHETSANERLTQIHKPSMGEKISGKLDQLVGKLTKNDARVIQGKIKSGSSPQDQAENTDHAHPTSAPLSGEEAEVSFNDSSPAKHVSSDDQDHELDHDHNRSNREGSKGSHGSHSRLKFSVPIPKRSEEKHAHAHLRESPHLRSALSPVHSTGTMTTSTGEAVQTQGDTHHPRDPVHEDEHGIHRADLPPAAVLHPHSHSHSTSHSPSTADPSRSSSSISPYILDQITVPPTSTPASASASASPGTPEPAAAKRDKEHAVQIANISLPPSHANSFACDHGQAHGHSESAYDRESTPGQDHSSDFDFGSHATLDQTSTSTYTPHTAHPPTHTQDHDQDNSRNWTSNLNRDVGIHAKPAPAPSGNPLIPIPASYPDGREKEVSAHSQVVGGLPIAKGVDHGFGHAGKGYTGLWDGGKGRNERLGDIGEDTGGESGMGAHTSGNPDEKVEAGFMSDSHTVPGKAGAGAGVDVGGQPGVGVGHGGVVDRFIFSPPSTVHHDREHDHEGKVERRDEAAEKIPVEAIKGLDMNLNDTENNIKNNKAMDKDEDEDKEKKKISAGAGAGAGSSVSETPGGSANASASASPSPTSSAFATLAQKIIDLIPGTQSYAEKEEKEEKAFKKDMVEDA